MSLAFDRSDVRRRAAALEAKLWPIAHRPVDLEKADWIKTLRDISPLDEAGIRVDAEALMDFLLAAYESGDDTARDAIRELMAEFRSFSWATGTSLSPETPEGFRRHVLRLSAIDSAQDLRDVHVSVAELLRIARHAGVETRPILEEVAAISSDRGHGVMGSIRGILLSFC